VVESQAGNLALLSTRARTHEPGSEPAEPRAEIWVRRRVGVRQAFRELWAFRELIRAIAERDLRTRYKQTVLGIAWVALAPVVLMLVFTLVFTRLEHVETQGVPYPLFAFIGLVPWSFFSASILTGGTSLITNSTLLNKLYCPREVFPLGSITAAAADAVISTLVFGALLAIEGRAPAREAFYAPMLLVILAAFTIGVTLAISATVVYIQDVRVALPLVVQLGLFATPVAYGTGVVATSRTGQIAYAALNPLAPVIDGLRRTVLLGEGPNWTGVIAGSCSALVVLAVGFVLFKHLETGLADLA
jgi:ABC-type polysaccharide/polyol phosphate export permease